MGMLGMAPWRKPCRLISRWSVSKRTGTSNSKPAVMTAPGAGMWPGAKVTTPVAVVDRVVGGGRLDQPGDGDEDGAGDGLGDVAGPGIEVGTVGLGELEQRGEAVAKADVLVERGGRRFPAGMTSNR